MALQKTKVLSTTDATVALQQYEEEVGKNILFVALGDTPGVKRMVEKADVIAGTANDLRRVIWAPKPEFIAGQISGHQRSSDLDEVDLDKPDRAYTLSFSNAIRDVIRHDEGAPDNIRIFKAYVRAEAN